MVLALIDLQRIDTTWTALQQQIEQQVRQNAGVIGEAIMGEPEKDEGDDEAAEG